MKFYSKLATVFCCLIVFQTTAQRILPPTWYNQGFIKPDDIKIGDGSVMAGFNTLPEESKLDYYWDEKFRLSKVFFYSPTGEGGAMEMDSIAGLKARIDLWNNRVEFDTPLGIKIMDSKRLSSVLLQNEEEKIEQYVQPLVLGIPDFKGIFKVLAIDESKLILMSKQLLVQNATYNAALDAGNKETTLDKKSKFHFWDGSKLVSIDTKNEVSKMLTSLNIDAKKYFKESGNKLKKEEDYRKLGFFAFNQ